MYPWDMRKKCIHTTKRLFSNDQSDFLYAWIERTLCHLKIQTFEFLQIVHSFTFKLVMCPCFVLYFHYITFVIGNEIPIIHGMRTFILVCFPSKTMRIKKPFWAVCGKIRPLLLNCPVSFVPGSIRCSLAMCLFYYCCFKE